MKNIVRDGSNYLGCGRNQTNPSISIIPHGVGCGDDADALDWGILTPQPMVGAKAARGHGDTGVPQ